MLLCIAEKESGGHQFDEHGDPLWSKTDDVGYMQIHATWIPKAKKMGLDVVNSEADNIKFGIYLYDKYGPTQWSTYRACEAADDV